MSAVYYKQLDIADVTIDIPEALLAHALSDESKAAWSLLNKSWQKIYGEALPKVEFLKSGKPIIECGYISISHSHGKVAVAFSKEVEVGVDIELIKKDYPKKIAEFINYSGEPSGFYSLWTQREAVIKALDLSSLKKGAEGQFSGFTTVIDNDYALSVYGVNASFIKA